MYLNTCPNTNEVSRVSFGHYKTGKQCYYLCYFFLIFRMYCSEIILGIPNMDFVLLVYAGIKITGSGCLSPGFSKLKRTKKCQIAIEYVDYYDIL